MRLNAHRRLSAPLCACGALSNPTVLLRAVVFLGIVTALAPHPARAVGLGPVTQQSALGQSLRVVVPVILAAGEEFAAECFKFASAASNADGIPQIAFGRVVVERTAAGTQLVVSSPRLVNDPVVRLTLQAGCDTAVRREYTLLMDPPAIEPVITADSAQPTEVAAAPPPVVRQPMRAARTKARDGVRGASTSRRAASSPTVAKPAAPKPKAVAKAAAKAAPQRPPPAVAVARPRLQVSSALPSGTAQKGARTPSEAEQEKAQQDLANAIEAETVVLRQRIVELTARVDRMQKEVEANEIAQRAANDAAKSSAAASTSPAGTISPTAQTPSAEATAAGASTPPLANAQTAANPPTAATPPPAAKTAPVAVAAAWWEENATLLAAIVGLGLLIAGGLLWKRRRDTVATEPWRAPGAAATSTQTRPGPRTVTGLGPRTVTGLGPRTVTGLRNVPAGVVGSSVASIGARTPATKTSEAAGTADADAALAASELAQVTEEARVAVELGHRERAVEVLSKHIRQHPHTSPAAWIMLLDLHHTNGDRGDFRRLSEEFHEQFNVQTPMWEGFGTSESGIDNGLDAFPHIVKEIVAQWRKPECGDYLEQLLYDNREGRRIGFPVAAYGDILMLQQVLNAPPVIDIEADLAFDAAPASTRAAASPSGAQSAAGVLAAAERTVARRPMPPESAARPAQKPIEFELELNPVKPAIGPRKPPS